MTRAGFIFAFMFVLICGAIAPAMAQTKEEIAQRRQERVLKGIDDAWRSGKYAGLREYIEEHINRFESLSLLSQWGQKNFVHDFNREPQVGFVYSEALQKLAFRYRDTRNNAEYHQEMNTGLTMFIGSQIIAFENVAQCDDTAVGEGYLQPWLGSAVRKEYEAYLSSLKPEQRATVWQDALKLAETRNLDRKDKSLCASGSDALARAQAANDCQPVKDKRGEVCNAAAYVKFRHGKAWNDARMKIQDAVKRRVQEGKL